jgi:hypothetical protein
MWPPYGDASFCVCLMNRSSLASLLLLLVATVLMLGAAEIGARQLGHQPHPERGRSVFVWSAPDPVLGWTNRPGQPFMYASATPPRFTFWPDTTRATRPQIESEAQEILLVVGDSYSQGLGVADHETFAWKLQQRFPQYDVRNLGTGGYGAHQARLSMERYIRTAPKPVTRIVFGFGSYMLVRDRATKAWVNGLIVRGDMKRYTPPHLDLVDGRLTEFPPRIVAAWPGANHSALINMAQDAWLRLADSEREDYVPETHAVFSAALTKLKQGAGGIPIGFAILRVLESERDRFHTLFRESGITFVDCSPPDMPFEHPNDYWHSRHADCIALMITAIGTPPKAPR